jgi:hypothetical protein
MCQAWVPFPPKTFYSGARMNDDILCAAFILVIISVFGYAGRTYTRRKEEERAALPDQ